jgi:transcriptional regulator with PAS, ATPase and Fis domain
VRALLKAYQHMAQEVAEAISAALQIETEIVDDTMTIIAGTGKYKSRINMKEENGEIEAGYLYGRVLQTQQSFFVEDAQSDVSYDPSVLQGQTEELAELCTPIHYRDKVIGVIGLIAFDEAQRQLLVRNRLAYLTFLQRMSDLLAGKIAEQQALDNWGKTYMQLETIMESIHEGIIAVDELGIISTCNRTAEHLIQRDKRTLIGTPIQEIWPGTPMLQALHTGEGYIEQEEIYKLGNHDMHFIVTCRPIHSNGRVAGVVCSFRKMADMRRLAYMLTQEPADLTFSQILGKSRSLSLILKQAQQVARGTSNILLTGESGTGKGMLAAAIHSASSRRTGPFIIVNCGAIPEALLESELFGYAGGAFTGAKKEGKAGKFEIADGGTIFLDEIGDLPLHLQVKLLHVVQSKQVERVGSNKWIDVNIRVISATNKDLEEMVRNREFREDLYFRLNVIPLHMPPLRERKEDIPLLMDYFLAKYRQTFAHPLLDFTSEVKQLFTSYPWPGNVRELENAIEYAMNMETTAYIGMDSVPVRIRNSEQQPAGSLFVNTNVAVQSLKEQIKAHEKHILTEMLQRFGHSLEAKRTIADILGIGLATLYRKLEEYQVLSPEKTFQ